LFTFPSFLNESSYLTLCPWELHTARTQVSSHLLHLGPSHPAARYSSSCLPLIKRQGLPRFQGNDIHIHIPGTYISESRQFLHHLLFGPRSWPSTSNASLLRPHPHSLQQMRKKSLPFLGSNFSNPNKIPVKVKSPQPRGNRAEQRCSN